MGILQIDTAFQKIMNAALVQRMQVVACLHRIQDAIVRDPESPDEMVDPAIDCFCCAQDAGVLRALFIVPKPHFRASQ